MGVGPGEALQFSAGRKSLPTPHPTKPRRQVLFRKGLLPLLPPSQLRVGFLARQRQNHSLPVKESTRALAWHGDGGAVSVGASASAESGGPCLSPEHGWGRWLLAGCGSSSCSPGPWDTWEPGGLQGPLRPDGVLELCPAAPCPELLPTRGEPTPFDPCCGEGAGLFKQSVPPCLWPAHRHRLLAGGQRLC